MSTNDRAVLSILTLPAILALLAVFACVPSPAAAQAPIDRFEQACGTDNPFFVTTCYARGAQWDEPALVAFRDTPDNSGQSVLATMRQIGAAYGVAYQPAEKAVYVAAYHKRGSPFGPSGGPGTIYRVDLTSGAVGPWLEVPNTGRDQHERADNYWPDTRARNFAGTLGLGDIDLNDDGSELYVMNLLERQIFRYRMADKGLIGRIQIGSAGEGWSSQARPFGLKVWQGKLYHGLVHTAYQSQDRGDLSAFVYQSDLDGSNMRMVNRFSLDYGRGNVFGNVPARWWPWKDGYNATRPGPLGAYPQPMLSDIEFADNGDMILGFRDRNGDMTFFDPGGRNPPGEGTSIPAGDILLGRFNGDTWDTATSPEFFAQDAGPGLGATSAAHDESSFGGLARVQGVDHVVNSALAPERISSGGGYWFDNTNGRNTAREEIYNYRSEVNYGKANGLGDVEILCGPSVETSPTPTDTEVPMPSQTATTPWVTETPTPSVTTTVTPTVTTTTTVTPTGTIVTTVTPTAATPTTTITPTATMAVTLTPGPTPNERPSSTAALPTSPPPKTPVPPTSPPEEEKPPPPSPTPEVPQLPKTGGTADWTGLLTWIGGLVIALAWLLRRRQARTAG